MNFSKVKTFCVLFYGRRKLYTFEGRDRDDVERQLLDWLGMEQIPWGTEIWEQSDYSDSEES